MQLTGKFISPWGVATDSIGQCVCSYTGNNRIQKFTNTGNFIRKWGTGGTGDGQFGNPFGIAVDPSGHVFVTDTDTDQSCLPVCSNT